MFHLVQGEIPRGGGGGALLSEKVRNARRNMCKLTKCHCLILRAHILVAEKVHFLMPTLKYSYFSAFAEYVQIKCLFYAYMLQ